MGTLNARPTVGGYAYTNDFLSQVSWHSEVIANGDLANDMQTLELIQATCNTSTGKWKQIIRAFYAFDTSVIRVYASVAAIAAIIGGEMKKPNRSVRFLSLAQRFLDKAEREAEAADDVALSADIAAIKKSAADVVGRHGWL